MKKYIFSFFILFLLVISGCGKTNEANLQEINENNANKKMKEYFK